MFGLGWEPGAAVVVSRRLLAKNFDGESGQSFAVYEYMLDVHPDDGSAAFRGTAKDPFNLISWRQPDVGEPARIKFHAKNHEVKFDHDDPHLHQDTPRRAYRQEVRDAHSAEAVSAWEALKREAPAQGVATSAPVSADPGIPAAPAEVRAAQASAQSTLNATVETLAVILAARAVGDTAAVDRLKAEFTQRIQQSGPPAVPAARDGQQTDGADRIARLEKLASLHDRGALTDTEFAAEKARILAEG